MPRVYTYYVPLLLHTENKVSFSARFYESDGSLNSEDKVWEMIDTLTAEFVQGEPEEGTLPVIPLGWQLVTAKQGPAVKPLTPKKKGNGRGHA